MSILKNDGGIMDVIRCDKTDYLIWKWHPKGSLGAKSKRAYSIRWGSSLFVKAGTVAIFVYSNEDGISYEYIEGPFSDIIETRNFPVLSSLVGGLFNGDVPFQAEIYFVNLKGLMQMKFGVPYFDVFDPRFLDYGVPTSVRGTMNFKISDYHEFIRLNNLQSIDITDLQAQIRDVVARLIKNVVSNIPENTGISVLQLERKISEINDAIEPDIKDAVYENFGITCTRLDISDIEIDKSSEGYKQLHSLTQNKLTTASQSIRNISSVLKIQKAGADAIMKSRGIEPSGNTDAKAKKGVDLENTGQKIGGLFSGAINEIRKATEKEDSNINLLKKYKELLDAGIITQEEFNEKKGQLL